MPSDRRHLQLSDRAYQAKIPETTRKIVVTYTIAYFDLHLSRRNHRAAKLTTRNNQPANMSHTDLLGCNHSLKTRYKTRIYVTPHDAHKWHIHIHTFSAKSTVPPLNKNGPIHSHFKYQYTTLGRSGRTGGRVLHFRNLTQ